MVASWWFACIKCKEMALTMQLLVRSMLHKVTTPLVVRMTAAPDHPAAWIQMGMSGLLLLYFIEVDTAKEGEANLARYFYALRVMRHSLILKAHLGDRLFQYLVLRTLSNLK